MLLKTFLEKLDKHPKDIAFYETMEVIEATYFFTPSAFKNGSLYNLANENIGSCKLFAFAKKQRFSKEETLACFGDFYFEEVLKDPEGLGHQNIRNFMKTGFEGLVFENDPLKEKNEDTPC